MPNRPISELVGVLLQGFSARLQSLGALDYLGNGLKAVRVNLAGDGFELFALTKGAVGLGGVDNTADIDKPVSSAQQAALDGKAGTGHAHNFADLGGKPTTLAGYGIADAAGSGHSHNNAASGAAGFMSGADKSKLDGVAAGATANSSDSALLARGNHTGSQPASTISDFSEAVDDRVAALLAQGSNITLNYNDAGGLLTITAAAGGADPWTYIRLASDFTTSSASAVDIPGLAFTPAANKRYEFEARLRLRTAAATVGPRPGVAWPTGFVDGGVAVRCPSAAGTEVMQFGNPNAAVLGPVGGLPNTTQSWPGHVGGEIEMGASPSGMVKLQLASETAATNVICKAGSFLRYREAP